MAVSELATERPSLATQVEDLAPPRRVVFFTETYLPRVDGIVNTLTWMLRKLVAAGAEPLVVAPNGNTGGLAGVRVLGASSVSFPLYPEVRLGLMGPGIASKLDAYRPELVHLAGPVVNGLAACCTRSREGCRSWRRITPTFPATRGGTRWRGWRGRPGRGCGRCTTPAT
jgi:hypothetical protein